MPRAKFYFVVICNEFAAVRIKECCGIAENAKALSVLHRVWKCCCGAFQCFLFLNACVVAMLCSWDGKSFLKLLYTL